MYYDLDHEKVRSDPSFIVSPFETQIEDRERWVEFGRAMEGWRGSLKKENERKLLETIIFLMKNAEMVDIYNKKAVYLYLRELTGMNTKQIMVNLKKIRSMYDEWYETYHSTGATTSERSDEQEELG